MPEVEVDGIAGEQPAHNRSEQRLTGPDEEVDVIGHECPGKALGAGLDKELGKVADKAAPVVIVAEYVTAPHATDNDVLEKIRGI